MQFNQTEVVRLVVTDGRRQPIMDSSQTRSKVKFLIMIDTSSYISFLLVKKEINLFVCPRRVTDLVR